MAPSRATGLPARREPSPAYAQWITAMTLEAEMPDDEEFDPAIILGDILAADTFEDAVAKQDSSLPSGKQLVGIAHRVAGFRLRKSDAKYSRNSAGVYAVVDAYDLESGQPMMYTVGALNVLAILWQARQFGKLPGDFVITSRDAQEGELLSLRPVGRRTVKVDSDPA
jgi:hypothetical protein